MESYIVDKGLDDVGSTTQVREVVTISDTFTLTFIYLELVSFGVKVSFFYSTEYEKSVVPSKSCKLVVTSILSFCL